MGVIPYQAVKAMQYLKKYGIRSFTARLAERFKNRSVPYEPWYQQNRASREELKLQRKESEEWQDRPQISVVVPAYETPELFLKEMIDSVREQSYTQWQLCIADGSVSDIVENVITSCYAEETRIKYQHLTENRGIAGNTNAALEMADGDWLGLLDHDDLLAPEALYEIANMIQKDKQMDVCYTDEDKISGKKHMDPHFKPDFSPDLLRSNNYITHFFVVRKKIMEQAAGFRSDMDGAQDYDYILRCIEKAGGIRHIPKILYHWRIHSGSTADNPASKGYALQAGKRAIETHLQRIGVNAKVSLTKDFGFYHVRYPVAFLPEVSIVVWGREAGGMPESLRNSTYPNYQEINLTGVTNWKTLNQKVLERARGEYLVFLHRRTELRSKDWIEQLLGICQQKRMGAAGAKIYYPNGRIRHAGKILGLHGTAGNAFEGMPKEASGYRHKSDTQLNCSAVSAECMMVSKRLFQELGGFDSRLEKEFQDVDFCLRLLQKGYHVVYNPKVEVCFRGTKKRTPAELGEIQYMREKWGREIESGDPYYNPNLSLEKANYSLKRSK